MASNHQNLTIGSIRLKSDNRVAKISLTTGLGSDPVRMTLDNMKIDDVSMPMIRVAVLLDRDVGLDAQPRDRCKASPLRKASFYVGYLSEGGGPPQSPAQCLAS